MKKSDLFVEPCPFCADTLRLIQYDYCYSKKDSYAVSKGHTLVIPYSHSSDYFDCTKEEKKDIWNLVEQVKTELDQQFNPDGYNIGINCGAAAGQTISHLHIHIIPRYNGDVADPSGGVRGVIPKKQKY